MSTSPRSAPTAPTALASTEPVLVERRPAGLLSIVLNRADKGNLLNAQVGEAIIAALAGVDDGVKLVRITAAGADFCAGRESPMPPAGAKPSAEQLRSVVAAPPLALYDAVKACRVPVIVVARGRSLGAGCALACVADITLADEGAVFQINEMERDIPPALVMSALIGRVPLKTIAYLVLSRAAIGAAEALQMGLVSRVLPSGRLDAEADALIATMLSAGPVALRAVKQYLTLAPDMPAAGASGLAAHLVATALSTKF